MVSVGCWLSYPGKPPVIWSAIASQDDWDRWFAHSDSSPFFLLKHSPRCALSVSIKSRLEANADFANLPVVILDVVAHRSLSQYVAKTLNLVHESPQLILIHGKQDVWDEDHLAIDPEEAIEAWRALTTHGGS
jgi:bacillithiol system protein YtxJ